VSCCWVRLVDHGHDTRPGEGRVCRRRILAITSEATRRLSRRRTSRGRCSRSGMRWGAEEPGSGSPRKRTRRKHLPPSC
jgi:hypothetical protein